ncbi:MAG: insulinase family protein [Gammaproteobacteria bacterium]|nr:insulinase family protein [Gammaproteobacteria bacterium]MCF6260055.1 insulinase family protein [Gammaproteobacteria bacterium]
MNPLLMISATALAAAALAGCTTGLAKNDSTETPTLAAASADVEKTGHIITVGDVHEYRLANGLKILIKEDHRAPIVVSQIWYKTGASYESSGTTGVAHVLEHMMFKGTKTLGPNEFSRIIAANGGRENAFTGQDYTAYFQQLEKSRLPISFELEADRMANLNLRAEDFAKEVKVVMEERRMRTEDRPRSLTYEHFSATAFVNSPYHHPIIGWMNDLENMNVDDMRNWYKDWYAPNNATLVVAGDVDAKEVFELAQKTYGKVKARAIPVVKPQTEFEQKGIKRIVVKAPAQVPYMIMGYKVPVVTTAKTDWEPYALEMLASILDAGESSRFAKELVRGQQIATSVGAGYNMYSRLGSLFIFDGTPAKGKTVEEVENAIHAQITKIKTERVSQAELDRIKAQVVASKVYEKDSLFYQAMQMGTLATVGLDWQLMDQFVERLRAVTPEQVQAVAKKYLIDDYLTVAVLDPQSTPVAANGDHSHAH